MKNLKLKNNVKNILVVCIGIFIIAICVKILNNDYNDAVDECVKGGNSYDYCVRALG